MRNIMLVDDDQGILNALQRNFRQLRHRDPYQIESYINPLDALKRISEHQFDLVIADFNMPDMDGAAFLSFVRQFQPNTVRLMLSASLDPQTLLAAINQAEAIRYIPKPWQISELQAAYDLACERYDKNLEEHRLADERRLETGELNARDLALRRLEEIEPGITKVNWGADGSVIID